MFKFQNLLLGAGVALPIFFFQGAVMKNHKNADNGSIAQAISTEMPLSRKAETLTQLGHEELAQGRPNQALASWQEATKVYQKLHNKEGVTGNLVNQSLALQDLGLNLQSCSTLLESLKLSSDGWICDSSFYQSPEDPLKVLTLVTAHLELLPVNTIALQGLGDVLRQLGKSDESELVLKKALNQAKRLTNYSDTNSILLSLANTEKFIVSQLRNKYADIENPIEQENTLSLIQKKALLSIYLFQQLSNSNVPQPIRLNSQINCLNFLLNIEGWSRNPNTRSHEDLTEFHAQVQKQIHPLVKIIQENSSAFSQLPANQSVLAQLNFATSLNQIQGEQLQPLAIHYAENALQTAERLGSSRLKSNSFGILSNLYKQKQESRSQVYLEKASNLAQAVQAPELAWKWQQQLGTLYQKQGQYDKAIQTYEASIANLNQVRGNLLSVNPDIQFSFRDQVEPVYRNYMQVLLAKLASNPRLDQPILEQVVHINEGLQSAELQDFLQCGKLDLISLNEVVKKITPSPSVIYIINLGNRIEVIVRSSDHLLHHHSVNSKIVEDASESLQQNLENPDLYHKDETQFLIPSQTLYHVLIAPIKAYLPQSGNLVFILDSFFQGIPMSLLHDGRNYLIKQYSISLTINSQLRQPKALRQEQLRALIAGLSRNNPNLKDSNASGLTEALPETLKEVSSIKKYVSSVELLNEKFTTERFQEEIDKAIFPIVHITTHGKFSSDPQKTVLLDWNQALNIKQMNDLLKGESQNQPEGIELLVLSACETAKGDRRSALGIAGIAAQAGARSTLASLWAVDAESTTVLMTEFYKGLKAGLPKAEALRQSQLKLMSDPNYDQPFYWAGFVLLGSWL